MSEDHSNVDKDPNRSRPKKKSDATQPNYSGQPKKEMKSKDYVSVPKSKRPEHYKNNPEQDEYNYRGSENQENLSSQKQKQNKSTKDSSGASKKPFPKMSKNQILELYAKAPALQDLERILSLNSVLFTKKPQSPINHETFEFDPNEALVKSNYGTTTNKSYNQPPPSGNNTNNGNSSGSQGAGYQRDPTSKPLEMFDFSKETQDPIKVMREKMKSGKPATKIERSGIIERRDVIEEAPKKEGDNGTVKKGERQEEMKKAETEIKNKQNVGRGGEGLDQGENEMRYSDVDAEFEKKLKNNEIEEGRDSDFDDLLQNQQRIDDKTRPEWEDVDSNQVARNIQKDEFIAKLPQDKRTIFGDKYIEKGRKGESFEGGSDSSFDTRGSAGVDFSKGNFDNETRTTLSDEHSLQQGMEYYNASNQRIPQQRLPQEYSMNPQGMGFGGGQQELNQNMYSRGGAGQQGQQMNPQYGNKGFPTGAGGQQQQQQQQTKVSGQGMNQTPTQQKPQPQTSASGLPSFIFKYFSPDYDAKLWAYIDLEKKVQGQYSGRTMDEWYSKGYLPLDLLVTIGQNNGFRSLKELSEVIINHQAQQEGTPKSQSQQSQQPKTSAHEQQFYSHQQGGGQSQQGGFSQQQSQPSYQQQQQQYYQQQQQQQHYQPQGGYQATSGAQSNQAYLAKKGGYDQSEGGNYYYPQQSQSQGQGQGQGGQSSQFGGGNQNYPTHSKNAHSTPQEYYQQQQNLYYENYNQQNYPESSQFGGGSTQNYSGAGAYNKSGGAFGASTGAGGAGGQGNYYQEQQQQTSYNKPGTQSQNYMQMQQQQPQKPQYKAVPTTSYQVPKQGYSGGAGAQMPSTTGGFGGGNMSQYDEYAQYGGGGGNVGISSYNQGSNNMYNPMQGGAKGGYNTRQGQYDE